MFRRMLLFSSLIILFFISEAIASYIFNGGSGGSTNCTASGITGVQFTDTNLCVWCATTTVVSQISLSNVSCPSSSTAGQCMGFLCGITYTN